jgi:hypothetical protein
MRSGADRRGCCVYSTTALVYATRYTVNLLTWLADVQTSATGISRIGPLWHFSEPMIVNLNNIISYLLLRRYSRYSYSQTQYISQRSRFRARLLQYLSLLYIRMYDRSLPTLTMVLTNSTRIPTIFLVLIY